MSWAHRAETSLRGWKTKKKLQQRKADAEALAEAEKKSQDKHNADINADAAKDDAQDKHNHIMQLIEKINSDSREYKAEAEQKTDLLESSMQEVLTQLATLITSLTEQRNSDSQAVGGRLTGFETELTKVSSAVLALNTKFDQLMTVVTNMAVPKGKGKEKRKDTGKTLIQVNDPTADSAATDAADADLDVPSTLSQRPRSL